MVQSISVSDLTQRVDAEMRGIVSSREMPLYNIMYYHLGWSEERPLLAETRCRGVLCLLACHALGGDLEAAAPAAAAVELVHNFTEIHDDVQAGSPVRDKRDAVWWVWGPAQAINAGDGMHALARLSLFRLLDTGVDPATTFDGLKILDQAALALCEGRYLDLEAQERIDVGVESYLAMASSKTGALFSGATKLGGLLAGADQQAMESLGDYGTKVGVVFQVRADLDELSTEGDPVSHEMMNKKKLLPVVYALEQATLSEKRRIGDIYFKRVLDPDDVVTLEGILTELGALEYCEALIEQQLEEASQAFEKSGVSDTGISVINDFVTELIQR